MIIKKISKIDYMINRIDTKFRSQDEKCWKPMYKDKQQNNFIYYLLAFNLTANKYLYFSFQELLLT